MFVSVYELTMTEPYYSKSIVYIRTGYEGYLAATSVISLIVRVDSADLDDYAGVSFLPCCFHVHPSRSCTFGPGG